jgi:hypothetical protein
MKPFREIWQFAFAREPAAATPPAPDQIALTFAAALLSSGRFGDDPGAAMDTAWTLVIPFYQGQLAYGRQVQTLFDISQHASTPEGDMSAAEARAYVAGEADPQPPLATLTIGPATRALAAARRKG